MSECTIWSIHQDKKGGYCVEVAVVDRRSLVEVRVCYSQMSISPS